MLFSTPSLLVLGAFATVGLGASLQQVSDFGANPSDIQMYLYAPDKVAANPAIIVAVSIRISYFLLPIHFRFLRWVI